MINPFTRQRVPAITIDPAGPFAIFLEPGDNVHTWTNFLNNYQMPTVQQVAVADALRSIRLPRGSLLCLVALLLVAQQGRSRWCARLSGTVNSCHRYEAMPATG